MGWLGSADLFSCWFYGYSQMKKSAGASYSGTLARMGRRWGSPGHWYSWLSLSLFPLSSHASPVHNVAGTQGTLAFLKLTSRINMASFLPHGIGKSKPLAGMNSAKRTLIHQRSSLERITLALTGEQQAAKKTYLAYLSEGPAHYTYSATSSHTQEGSFQVTRI